MKRFTRVPSRGLLNPRRTAKRNQGAGFDFLEPARSGVIAAWRERRSYDWLSTIADPERREYHRRTAAGMTGDEARAEIARAKRVAEVRAA